MPISSAPSLLEILRRTHLLEPAQVAELAETLPARSEDARALADELIQRGWLTPYQVSQLFQDRADDLTLGHYVLLDRLGEGGRGQVFKARERRLGRIVAVKVLPAEQAAKAETVRRFHQEIAAVARLSHPHIVHAYDAEQIGAFHLYAMEYVEGIDLARRVEKSGPLPVALACEYVRQAALGLQHIHEHGMVHRDIKPANLMCAEPDGTIKILDMGLARLLVADAGETPQATMTRLGSVLGTVDYVAPEQAIDSHRADIRSDLYSLGCSFYFLLTGRAPFIEPEPIAKLIAHQRDPATPIEQLRPEVPPRVSAIVAKLMAKAPNDRYQTPNELVRELASGSVESERQAPREEQELSASSFYRQSRAASKPKRRWALWIAAAALALVSLLIGALVLFLREEQPSPPAEKTTTTAAAEPSDPEREITNSLGMKLVRIPAGDFFMGSPADEPSRRRDEDPSHRVTISQPFYLGAYLVTVGEFRAFAEAAHYRTEAEKKGEGQAAYSWRRPGWKQTDKHPVAWVNWYDAKAFCDWLSRKEQRSYRLPTEAEWEYACRAGSTSAYSYGPSAKKLDDYGWYRGNAGGAAHPVGQLKPNRWGLFDMHGNLCQWCGDWYDARFYQRVVLVDPHGPARGSLRLARGGAWNRTAVDCRSARRDPSRPTESRNDHGFRIVLVPPSNGHDSHDPPSRPDKIAEKKDGAGKAKR